MLYCIDDQFNHRTMAPSALAICASVTNPGSIFSSMHTNEGKTCTRYSHYIEVYASLISFRQVPDHHIPPVLPTYEICFPNCSKHEI